jgi:hypothetical protein
MKISELKNAPEWLVLADTFNADVEITSYGWVIWRGGNFLGGDFRGGDFRGGNFLGGNFLGGDFLGGNFLGGNFLGGDFRGGNFLGGNFLGGDFLGGNFRGGDFRGGNFRGGNFRGGVMMPTCKWVFGVTAGGKIKIGCEEKTIEEWDAWFAGSETFSTPRNTVAFQKIQASYEATKAYLKIVKPFELES